MKKLLFFVLLGFIAWSNGAFATGSGTITIVNNTDFTAQVIMYASAPSSCSGYACYATYITNGIVVNYFSTWGAYTPCNVGSSPGWGTAVCPTLWCSSLPSDFMWTEAEIYLSWSGGTYPIFLSYSKNCISPSACNGYPDNFYSSTFFLGTGEPVLTCTWTGGCGAMADVTITLTQSP